MNALHFGLLVLIAYVGFKIGVNVERVKTAAFIHHIAGELDKAQKLVADLTKHIERLAERKSQ